MHIFPNYHTKVQKKNDICNFFRKKIVFAWQIDVKFYRITINLRFMICDLKIFAEKFANVIFFS